MANGYGMGVTPQQMGGALMQQAPSPAIAPEQAAHAIGSAVAAPVMEDTQHSQTATTLAIGEALTRLGNGVRRGEYQEPKSQLAIDQLHRAGLSPVEISILLRSGGE